MSYQKLLQYEGTATLSYYHKRKDLILLHKNKEPLIDRYVSKKGFVRLVVTINYNLSQRTMSKKDWPLACFQTLDKLTSDIHSWEWVSYQQLFAFFTPKNSERDGNSRMQVWNDMIEFFI